MDNPVAANVLGTFGAVSLTLQLCYIETTAMETVYFSNSGLMMNDS